MAIAEDVVESPVVEALFVTGVGESVALFASATRYCPVIVASVIDRVRALDHFQGSTRINHRARP